MANRRVELPGSSRDPLPGYTTAGPADPSQQAYVTIVLRRKEPVLPITPFGAPKRVDEYTQAHGARSTDLEAVRSFAVEYGMQARNENTATRTVELHGTIGNLCRAFGTVLETARNDHTIFRHRTGYITVPENLIPVVEAVLGLDNRPAATPHRVGFRAKHAAARAAALSLSEVANFYEFPAHLDGSGQTIAIIELDGGTILADVAASFRKLALKPPEIEIVLIDGQTNTIGKHLPLHPELNADDQVAMDIEIAGAIAPGARQVVYFAENTDQSFLKAVNAAIFATPRPVCISIGWGHPENSYTKQAMRAFEAAFQDAANLGIPVCVSVGNGGSFEKPTSLQVDFPASSPHALSCGGTTLHASEGAITRETGWSEVVTDDQGKKVRRGTGSGVSQFFAKPVYQSSVAVLDPPEGSTGGRGVPDVSANADPATGYQIRVKGREETIGGTSAAAPLWAGLIARMGQAVGGPVGFLNPQIYRTRIRAEGFRDITEGSRHGRGADGPYQATSGWNPCTGLGTPKGMALLRALGTPLPPQPKAKPRVTAQHMTSQILERARRSASSAQPETPSPNLVEKKAVPHLPPAQPKIRRPVAPAAQMMAAVPLPAMKAAPAALEPAALIAPPRPALDQHEMGGPGASTTLPTDSFLFPAPPRNDGVSPSWQHGSGMGRDSDSAALAGILGITALTGMAAAVATLTCIALGNVKSSA